MSGVKGRSGGSKRGSRPNNGGARTGSGRPVRRIQLPKDSALELRILVLNAKSMGSQMDEHQFVAMLIRERWVQYDSHINNIVSELSEYE